MVWRRTTQHCDRCKRYYYEVPAGWECMCHRTCNKCNSITYWDGSEWICIDCEMGFMPEEIVTPKYLSTKCIRFSGDSDVWK